MPHQREFFFCQDRIKALVAGLGSGKTHIFLRETLKQHLLNYNPKTKQSKGWIIYPTFDLAEDVFEGDFLALLDETCDYDYNQSKHRFRTAYGDIKLYSQQNPKRAVGTNLTFAGIDEFDIETTDKSLAYYKKILGRLRGSPTAQLYITTTPEGFKATYQIFEKEKKGTLIRAKSYDNPYLDLEFIKSLLDDYDEQMQKQYLDGEFVNINGKQAYFPFSRDKNLMKMKTPYVFKTNTLYFGMDFNIDHFSITVSEMHEGQLKFGREHRFKNFRTQDAVRFIEEVYKDFIVIITPDMTGNSRKTSAEFTDLIILRQGKTKPIINGIAREIPFRIIGDVNPTHRDRINTVNNSLDKLKVMIHPDCEILIGDLEKVVTDAYGFIDKSQETQGLVHMSDAFGYTIINLFPLSKREYTRVG